MITRYVIAFALLILCCTCIVDVIMGESTVPLFILGFISGALCIMAVPEWEDRIIALLNK